MKKQKSNNSKEKIKKALSNQQKKLDVSSNGHDCYSDFGGLPMRDLKKNLGCG